MSSLLMEPPTRIMEDSGSGSRSGVTPWFRRAVPGFHLQWRARLKSGKNQITANIGLECANSSIYRCKGGMCRLDGPVTSEFIDETAARIGSGAGQRLGARRAHF